MTKGNDRIVLVAEELVAEGEDGDVARCTITRAQAAGFAIRATTLVEAGRPPCPLCGLPLDPSGHGALGPTATGPRPRDHPLHGTVEMVGPNAMELEPHLPRHLHHR